MTSSATKETTKGSGETLPVGPSISSRLRQPLADRLLPWLQSLVGRGGLVLVGDPGRTYLPKTGLTFRASYEVPVTRALEDAEIKKTSVWEFMG